MGIVARRSIASEPGKASTPPGGALAVSKATLAFLLATSSAGFFSLRIVLVARYCFDYTLGPLDEVLGKVL